MLLGLQGLSLVRYGGAPAEATFGELISTTTLEANATAVAYTGLSAGTYRVVGFYTFNPGGINRGGAALDTTVGGVSQGATGAVNGVNQAANPNGLLTFGGWVTPAYHPPQHGQANVEHGFEYILTLRDDGVGIFTQVDAWSLTSFSGRLGHGGVSIRTASCDGFEVEAANDLFTAEFVTGSVFHLYRLR